MTSQLGHGDCVALKADLLDLRYTCRAIGVEHEPEEPGHEVVELGAGSRVGKFSALGASLDLFAVTTGAYLAPSGLCVLVASLALPTQAGFAGTAIKSAMGNQFSLCLDYG